MSTVSTTTRRSANMNFVIALAITLVAILAFAVAQSMIAPKPAAIPVTGSQNAFVEYLRGEKTIYANPVGLSEALSAYHLGEKPLTNASEALSMYRLGEKTLYAVPDLGAALSAYHLGEKAIYTNAIDTSSALTAYHLGEKAIVRFEALESALWEYRLGEKGIK